MSWKDANAEADRLVKEGNKTVVTAVLDRKGNVVWLVEIIGVNKPRMLG